MSSELFNDVDVPVYANATVYLLAAAERCTEVWFYKNLGERSAETAADTAL